MPRARRLRWSRGGWFALCGLWVAAALGQSPTATEDRPTSLPGSGETITDTAAPALTPPETVADALPTRLEAQIAFNDLVAAERYEEAVVVGERYLELTDQEFGLDSKQFALALANVAEIQRRVGEHLAAEEKLLRSIEIIRGLDGGFSEALVVPLIGLGANYHDDGNYLDALSAFSEARNVNRRVLGLLNEDQLPIMDRMTETLYSMDRIEEADEIQRDALKLMERKQGSDSIEVIDAVHRYADWLGRTGNYNAEREQYSRILGIVRSAEGDDSPAMIRALREIGNSFREQRLEEGQGLGALLRARDIAERQPDPDWLALAEALRDLGDWYAAFSRVGPTGEEYRRAWQALDKLPAGERLQRRWFRGPEYVLREPVSQRGVTTDPAAAAGYVLVEFDLDTEGRPESVRVVESHPAGFKDDAVARSVQRSRFRPQMRDGEIVRGEKLSLRFAFRYEEEGPQNSD
jgi:TonB family protein